ncbi:MAG: ABC transporter transmembrane domain-containing protein, partial [Alphaproteobacteria bacterium]
MTKQESAMPAGRGIWRRLLEDHVRPHAAMLALAIAAMIVAAVATAANAWLMEPVLDKVFLERRKDLLWIIPGAVVLAALVKSAATYAQSVIMTKVGQGIIADIQARLFDHLLAADLQFFHDHPPGKLIARFINDVATLRGVITQATTGLVKDAVTAACLVGLLFWQDWQLALVTFFVFPLALVPARILGRRMRRVTTGAQERIGELSALLDETFQGARQVKAYAMEATESARARSAIGKLRALSVKSALTRAASHPIMETLSSFAIAAVILYGGHQV